MRIALRCAASVLGLEKCVPVTSDGARRGDEGLVDVVLAERHVGAVLAVEDQREGLLVLDRRGGPARSAAPGRSRCRRSPRPRGASCSRMKRPICSSPTRVMSAGLQAEPGRADGDVGRAAADRLGEGGDVLQARADLLAVEIDRGAADGDDVERFGRRHRPRPSGHPCDSRHFDRTAARRCCGFVTRMKHRF